MRSQRTTHTKIQGSWHSINPTHTVAAVWGTNEYGKCIQTFPLDKTHSTHIYQSTLHQPKGSQTWREEQMHMEIKKYCLFIEKEYAIVHYFSLRWNKATSSIVTVSVPQTVLHSPGIVHDRARGPKEQHTQASETPQDLHKTKHLVYICNKGQRRSWFLKYVAFGSFIHGVQYYILFVFAFNL